MSGGRFSAATPLADLPGLPVVARQKLHSLHALTLGDLAAGFSERALRRIRRLGPQSVRVLVAALEEAGLALQSPVSVLPVAPPAAASVSSVGLDAVVDEWIRLHRPAAWHARAEHREGAYGGYLQVRLDALDQLALPAAVRQQERHKVVRLLGRYRRQVRAARSRDALREGVFARG